MDGHFWGKYIQNSPTLLKNLQETLAPWMANSQFLAKSLTTTQTDDLTGWIICLWPSIVKIPFTNQVRGLYCQLFFPLICGASIKCTGHKSTGKKEDL